MTTEAARRPANPIADLVPFHHVQYDAPCNLRCFYCYEAVCRETDPDKMSAAIVDNLRHARAAGYRIAAFGAGELVLLRGWEEAVARARALGFDDCFLITNLTLLDEAALRRVAAAGITGIAGTFFATNDADAAATVGRADVFSRQIEAAGRIVRHPDLGFTPHVMLTRAVAADPLGALERLRDALGAPLPIVMISAIEPLSEAIRAHPAYTDGLDVPWESLLRRADAAGFRVVVQNLPACLLGDHAHRSFVVRKRVARLLAGWPDTPERVRQVAEQEGLFSRDLPDADGCAGCGARSVCQRYYAYPTTRPDVAPSDTAVVTRLLAEEGLDADVPSLVRGLRWFAARTAPDGKLPPT